MSERELTKEEKATIQKLKDEAQQELLKKITKMLNTPLQEITEKLGGSQAEKMQNGNSIVTVSRVISGNYNRVAQLFDFLTREGIDVADERTSFFGATIGFSPELSPTGLRGEYKELIKPEPKKAEQSPVTQNIMSNPQQSQGGQE